MCMWYSHTQHGLKEYGGSDLGKIVTHNLCAVNPIMCLPVILCLDGILVFSLQTFILCMLIIQYSQCLFILCIFS